ncbi:MAG: hypothetical protein ACE5OR_13755 [bacterium]
MATISAFFDNFIDRGFEEKLSGRGLITRLWCWVRFKRKADWSWPYSALMDSGAHTSIIPKKIWRDSEVKKMITHYVRVLVPKEECKLKVEVGEADSYFS